MKRLLAAILSLFLAASIAGSSPSSVPIEKAAEAANVHDTNEITVYVTKTGSKYHRDGCRYLRQSKIPMSLTEAKRRFDPCSVCQPPQ